MKNLLSVMTVLVFLLAGCSQPEKPDGPVAARHPATLSIHGETRTDPYLYLADKGHPDTRRYLQDEQDYLAEQQARFRSWESSYRQQMARWLSDDLRGLPVFLDGYWYERRVKPGGQYAVYERWRTGGARQVLLDLNELDGEGAYLAVGSFGVHATRLAVTLDSRGDERYRLLLRDLSTGEFETIVNETGPSVAWSPTGDGIYYTDAAASRVYFRDLSLGITRLVYEESDPAFSLRLRTDGPAQRVLLTAESHDATEIRWIADRQVKAPIAPRQPGHIYRAVTAVDGKLWLLSNLHDQVFRLAHGQPDSTGIERWTFLDVATPGTIRDYGVVDDRHLVLRASERLMESVLLLDTVTGVLDTIYVSDTAELRLVSSSPGTLRFVAAGPVTPETGFEYDVGSGQLAAISKPALAGLADYQADTLWVQADDGAQIPVTLIRQRDAAPGPQPVLVHAYGAYGVSLSRRFDPARMPYLENGLAYVIAHIRGGGALGEAWHAAARLENKPRSFDDFDAVVSYLVDAGIAAPDRVFARGRSAGGTVMGVAVNRHPERYRGVIAEVPFVDLLTTLAAGKHRLVAADYLEWGDPDNRSIYELLKTYSPYDNVQPSVLPAILVRVDLDDARVGYHEGLKWMAKLRHQQQGNALLLMDITRETGHLGPSDQHARLQQDALDYAFIMSRMD